MPCGCGSEFGLGSLAGSSAVTHALDELGHIFTFPKPRDETAPNDNTYKVLIVLSGTRCQPKLATVITVIFMVNEPSTGAASGCFGGA